MKKLMYSALIVFLMSVLMVCSACGNVEDPISSTNGDMSDSSDSDTSTVDPSNVTTGTSNSDVDSTEDSSQNTTNNSDSSATTSGTGTNQSNGTTETPSATTSKTNGNTSTTKLETTSTTQKVQPNTKLVPEQHMLKTYIADGSITKTQFLSSVAYMEDGEIKDTLFKSFVFSPTPAFMYDYVSKDQGQRQFKKDDWLSFVYDYTFKPGKNMDALEEAVESVKTTLGLKDYKVQVYLSLLNPVTTVTDFGEVNGKNLDFSKEADRLEAVKWLAQEQLKAFKSKNYKNIEVAGFFWFKEEIVMQKEAVLVKQVVDYIHSIGYLATWSPYFGAQGFDQNDKFGFDVVTMQANYYPDSANIPNNGPVSRLRQLAAYTEALGIGAEMEIGSSRPASVKGFKEYIAAGLEYGFSDKYHVWYLNGGPAQIYSLYHSRDAYVRSGYSDMYKYIKGTLKLSDVMLEF